MAHLSQTNRWLLSIAGLWAIFYCSFALFSPPLLDDADSVHAEVAREMVQRNDWVTPYANGIRLLDRAPLIYWSMAAGMRVLGPYAASARLPVALMVLALVMTAWLFATRIMESSRAGFYAAMVLLSCCGTFLFTRTLLPEIGLCLWLAVAITCFALNERRGFSSPLLSWGFAASCALGVLTKGLIGLAFPVAIVLAYLLLAYGRRGFWQRVWETRPVSSLFVFLAVAAPWYVLVGTANPVQGNPGRLTRVLHYLLHESQNHDTIPLWLFWGLLLVWLMPWSVFLFHALKRIPWKANGPDAAGRTKLLLGVWAAAPMIFFSFMARQEYFVLSALPALALLIAGWMEDEVVEAESFTVPNPLVLAGQRISTVLFVLGTFITIVCGVLVLNSKEPASDTELASLLQQNPAHYAASFGHFLDLNSAAIGVFSEQLGLTAVAFGVCTAMAWWKRRQFQIHVSNLWIAGLGFTFLLAAHTGLRIFAPALTSKQFAGAIKAEIKPNDLVVIHGEYEQGSSLAFYLWRNDLHLYEGRTGVLKDGSFLRDAPKVFEDEASMRSKWNSPTRVFMWTEMGRVPAFAGKDYLVVMESGNKELITNFGKK